MALSINSTSLVNLGAVPLTGYPFAMTGWFRVPDKNIKLSLMRFENTSTGSYFELLFGGHSTKWVGAAASVSGLSIAKSTLPMTPGKWHQVTGLFLSATSRKIYLDGGNTGSTASSKVFDGADLFYLGNKRSSDFVDAADIAVIDSILADEEIAQLALGVSVLSLPSVRDAIVYHDCVRRLNHHSLGPSATSGQPVVQVEHPRMIHSASSHTAAMPFRIRGPFNVDRGECQSFFSEQAESAVSGIESDSTIQYGEVLS